MTEPNLEEKQLWQTISSSDYEEKTDALLQLSYIASQRGEHDVCLALRETARDHYENSSILQSNTTLAHIYLGIAYSLQHLARPADAAKALHKSAELYIDLGIENAQHIYNEEGDAWYEAKEYEKSFDAYIRALNAANPDTCEQILAKNYADAGTALIKLKEWVKAITYFLEARKIYKKLKDPINIVHCDEEISLCYFWIDDGVNSLYYAQLAIDFAITAEDDYHYMWALARMGLAKKCLGEYEEALSHFSEAKTYMTKQLNPPWEAIVKLERQLADILRRLGREVESAEIIRRISSFADIFLEEGESLDAPH